MIHGGLAAAMLGALLGGIQAVGDDDDERLAEEMQLAEWGGAA